MHEVAESRPGALSHLVLAATRLPEVGDRRQLGVNGPASEPAVVQLLDGLLGVFFFAELDVDVANEMVAQVVADVHLLNLTILVLRLDKDVLKEVVIMFLRRKKPLQSKLLSCLIEMTYDFFFFFFL